jgi:hypothetical protein
MSPAELSESLPYPGQVVRTACGGQVEFSPDTPRSLHEGYWIYFCLPVCQNDFQQDPASSCLHGEIGGEN